MYVKRVSLYHALSIERLGIVHDSSIREKEFSRMTRLWFVVILLAKCIRVMAQRHTAVTEQLSCCSKYLLVQMEVSLRRTISLVKDS